MQEVKNKHILLELQGEFQVDKNLITRDGIQPVMPSNMLTLVKCALGFSFNS